MVPAPATATKVIQLLNGMTLTHDECMKVMRAAGEALTRYIVEDTGDQGMLTLPKKPQFKPGQIIDLGPSVSDPLGNQHWHICHATECQALVGGCQLPWKYNAETSCDAQLLCPKHQAALDATPASMVNSTLPPEYAQILDKWEKDVNASHGHACREKGCWVDVGCPFHPEGDGGAGCLSENMSLIRCPLHATSTSLPNFDPYVEKFPPKSASGAYPNFGSSILHPYQW